MRGAAWVVLPLVIVLATSTAVADDGYLDGWADTTVPNNGTTSVRSALTIMYFDPTPCSSCIIGMTGTHEIRGSSGEVVKQANINAATSYRDTLSYPGAPSQCYFTRGRGVQNHYNPPFGATGPVVLDDKEFISAYACVPAQSRTCLPGQYDCDSTPIIISLRGDYHLTSALDGVRFDIDADGARELVSWTAPGTALAFLALDRNQNGRIDDGSELFGDHTPLADGRRAANGWDALAELDVTGDGLIALDDPVWSNLLLWIDANHDGSSNPSELTNVASSVVRSIGVDYKLVGRRDPYGNLFRFEGQVFLQHGRRAAYDVVLMRAD